jgi:hypothetical protein
MPARIAKPENEDLYFDEMAIPVVEILVCVSANYLSNSGNLRETE